MLNQGPVAQLVRAPPCHGGGREFESLLGRGLSICQGVFEASVKLQPTDLARCFRA